MRYLQFVIISLLSVCIVACQSEQPREGSISISGLIKSMGTDNKIYYATTTEYEELEMSDSIFSIILETDRPLMVSLIYNQRNWDIFARPGDNIQLSFDRYDFSNFTRSIVYEGDLAAENDFLIALKEAVELDREVLPDFYGSDEKEFINRVGAVQDYADQKMKEFVNDNRRVDQTFRKYARKMIEYTCANYFNEYKKYHGYYAKDAGYSASNLLLGAQQRYELEDASLIGLPAYIQYLENYLIRLANAKMENVADLEDQKAGYLQASMDVIEEQLDEPQIIEHQKYARLRDHLDLFGIDGSEKYYNKFLVNCENEQYKKKLVALYKKWEHLKKGKPAPEFSYPDVNGQSYALNDFAGKYVYIDVWATWCQPCLRERPSFEALIKKYANNDQVAFLGVSIDANKQAWKEMVIRDDLLGTQIIADKAWDSNICEDYNIKGIPRYILIDPQGKLLAADAYRPSSLQLATQLEALLQ